MPNRMKLKEKEKPRLPGGFEDQIFDRTYK